MVTVAGAPWRFLTTIRSASPMRRWSRSWSSGRCKSITPSATETTESIARRSSSWAAGRCVRHLTQRQLGGDDDVDAELHSQALEAAQDLADLASRAVGGR